MQRVTRSSAVATMPARPANPSPPGWFTQGNPGGGVPATVPGYEWFNGIQAEMIALIERSGLTPDPDTLDQVRRSMDRLHGGGATTIAANATLTLDQAGLVLIDASGGSRTITLPAANAMAGRPIQYRLVRLDASANTVTIQRAGADTFRGGGTSVTIARSSSLVLSSDGVSVWDTLAEHARGRSIASPGWTTLPGGLILQWGQTNAIDIFGSNVTVTATFPIAFPTAVLSIQATARGTGGSYSIVDVAATLTGCTVTVNEWTSTAQSAGANYLAIGH